MAVPEGHGMWKLELWNLELLFGRRQKKKKDQRGKIIEQFKIWLEDREISIKAWEQSRVGICKASSKTEGVKNFL